MKTLDVSDLPQSRVDYLGRLIEQWRREEQRNAKDAMDEDIVFAIHKSTVIGPLTRREIYEDV